MSIKTTTNEIIERLNEPALPGGVREYYNVCGKPNCQCKHPETPKPHGPYTQLSYSVSGKSSTISISPKEASSARKAVKNFKALKSLVNELALTYAGETRVAGVSFLKRFKLSTAGNMEKDKPAGVKLRLLQESREKWKVKALSRQDELEKKRIKIRDLQKSREKWKERAIKAQRKVAELRKKIADTEKKITKIEKSDSSKKNSAEDEENELMESPPCGFHFPLKTIVMAIRLVVFGLLSLRGATKTFLLFNDWFGGGIPCHVVIQNWKLFVDYTCKTKRSLVHTVLGYLAPPRAREKSRWLNLDGYIEWAENVLCFGKEKMRKAERDKFNDKLSWIRNFKPHMAEWRTILDVLPALKNEVKSNGLNEKTADNFEKSVAEFKFNTPRLIDIRNEVLAYLKEECEGMTGVFPGCTDIIESVFGKYKIFSGKSPMKEVGKTILTIPVFTSDIDDDEVKTAMESVSAKDVNAWLNENIGRSLFSKRKEVYSLKKIKSSVKNIPDKLKKVAGF